MPLPLILGTNAVTGGYDVANSLRFNDGSSDYLSRTPSGAGSTTKGTFSFWIKRGNVTQDTYIWTNYADGTNWSAIGINNVDQLYFYAESSGSAVANLKTNRVFRDVSAWYHIVVAVDSTDGTADDRIKIYVNGVQETSFVQRTNPGSSADLGISEAVPIEIGRYGGGSAYFDGYMAEVVMIDNTTLAASDFGEFDEDSPTIWKPKDVSGLTFGTNGFYLDFEDSSSLGNDAAGSNNFAVNNLTAVDQSTDTCTNNFATLNPLNSSSNDSHTPPTYSEGNLQSASPSSGGGYVGSSTIGVTNGKWFWEFKKSGGSATNIYNGIGNEVGTAEIARNSAVGVYYGNQVFYRPDGTKQIITNGSNANSSYGASWTTNDIIGIALDLDSGTNTVTFYKNGASQGAINLPVNTDTWFFIAACGTDTVDTWQLNFGSPPYAISSGNTDGNGYGNFEYAVPSGYFSLNTKNLAEYG